MKKVVLSVFALATLTLVSCKNEAPKAEEPVNVEATAADAVVYNADSTSIINWVGSKVGGEHKGTLNLKSGEVAVKDGAVQNGTFVLDLNSITVTDLDGDMKANLEAHLKGTNQDDSADHFFNTAQFPEGKFEIATLETVDGQAKVTGNLTLKGITKSVSFPATIAVNDTEVKIETSEFTINRTDFNINYGSKTKFTDLAADKVINDEIKLQLVVVAKK